MVLLVGFQLQNSYVLSFEDLILELAPYSIEVASLDASLTSAAMLHLAVSKFEKRWRRSFSLGSSFDLFG
jgi:hypothetical protein